MISLSEKNEANLHPLSAQKRAYLHLAKPVALVQGVAVLAVPHTKAKDFIEGELGSVISQVLSAHMGRSFALAVTIDPQVVVEQQNEHEEITQVESAPQPAQIGWETTHSADDETGFKRQTQVAQPDPISFAQANTTAATLATLSTSPSSTLTETTGNKAQKLESLNPAHTFDNYVISDSNKLPASAAIAVAEKPARAYNPLFIWGDSGLGKTHLMHAIGNYAHQLNPELKIKYVSSEEFTNDYINSVRDDRQTSFKRRYREVDILMVDDIQFLQGKEGTQEEFFHTFNALEQSGKQIVLSSDRPPKQLTTLEDRLRTRFQAGLIADIYPPDLETRIAILSKKSRAEGIEADREVLELIASRFDSSIRELEGAFIRVSAYASVNKIELTRETAEVALQNITPDQSNVDITPDTIIEVTADYFKVKAADIRGKVKRTNIAHARQIAMYLCRELTELSLPKIGENFGGKDHTTVMYADRKIRKEIAQNKEIYNEIQQITMQIKG
nr:chromosomal replication initiator protein DnaA [Corynebacterium sp. sy017]